MKSNVLLFDIETAPCTAYIWGLYKEVTDMKFVEHDWYILCWSAKWLGDKEICTPLTLLIYIHQSEGDSRMGW